MSENSSNPNHNTAPDNIATKKLSGQWKEQLAKFREEWNKKLIAGAVAITFTLIGFFGKWAFDVSRRAWNQTENISREQAMQTAKQHVGESVVVAEPFRNLGDDRQYIAVAAGKLDAMLEVYLLVGKDERYELKKLDAGVYDTLGIERIHDFFGLLDIDNNGKKQIFAVTRSGGTGVYSVDIDVYDPDQATDYTLSESGDYTEINLTPVLSDNTATRGAMKQWLQEKGREMAPSADPGSGYSREVELWRQSQGSEFSAGHIEVHEFSGKIPMDSAPSVGCRVDDGVPPQLEMEKAFVR